LGRQIRKISHQTLGPGNRTIEQDDAATTLGLKVLEKQSGHTPGADNSNLLLI
jgi:hypothetical protein